LDAKSIVCENIFRHYDSHQRKFKPVAETRTLSEDMLGSKKLQNPTDLAFFKTSLPPDFRDVHSSWLLFEDIRKFGGNSNVQTTGFEDLAKRSAIT